MPEEDGLVGGNEQAAAARLRRPPLERVEPRRGWGNLYAPGKADAVAPSPAPLSEPPPESAETPTDAAGRVIRDGYRVVEENLRRGRQVAAELRGVQREVASFAGRLDAQRLVGSVTQTVIDPALSEQLSSLARSVFAALGSLMPGAPAPTASPASTAPLHPQARADYAASDARVLKLRSVGPGEWLADIEIEGQVRRVQVRAVDGEL